MQADIMVSLGPSDAASGSLEIAPEELSWRLVGDTWEPIADEDDDESCAEGPSTDALVSENEGSIVRLQEIAAAIHEHERQQGSSVDQECLDALGSLPASQQRHFAVGFREFTEAIM